MTMEIRDNSTLSVLPLAREKISIKASTTNVSTQDSRETIVQVKSIGSESDSYSEPGSVIDIYA
jgi:hypothetical protein